MHSSGYHLLAGDIGATKTTLAVYALASCPGPPLRVRTFQNAAFQSFDDLLLAFFSQDCPVPARACFGVAGPVMSHAVKMTNLNWLIETDTLQQRFGFSQVALINDLMATAMGVLQLPASDLHTLNPGKLQSNATLAVLAPGSGLGEAFLVHHKGGYIPCPSEGGHASFAPRNAEQIDLLALLLNRQEHVAVEQVCSGLAIPDLFAFMTTRHPVPEWLQSDLDQATDRTPVIVQAAVQAIQGGRSCDVAVHTLNLFADILADEAANLALKTLALGGLFLGGGLAPRLLPFLTPKRFMATFARGGYRDWLSRLPIHVILNPQTALLGAAAYGVSCCTR